MTGSRWIAPLVGAGLVAAHAAVFPLMLHHCGREPLTVRVTAPPAAPALTVDAALPSGIYDRVVTRIDGTPAQLATARVAPGLHHVDWTVGYRGGFERSAGLTQLVGPFQDAAAPPCSVRLIIGQTFLDGGPGSVTTLARRVIEEQLRGFEQWPIGSFRGVDALSIRWSDRRGGSLLVEVTLRFSRGKVPLEVDIVPHLRPGYWDIDDPAGGVALKAYAKANLDLDSRIYQWLADLFDAEKIAGATAEDEVIYALRGAFRPPPPVPLPGGRKLVFAYCPHQEIEVAAGRYAAVPLQLRIDGGVGDVHPISFGPPEGAPPPISDAPISLEFSLDAVNAVLFYLWHTGYLDQQLDAAGVDQRFNADSAVKDLLSIRIAGVSLALPPTASPGSDSGRSFTLAASADLTIRDGATETPAHAFATVGFDVTGGKAVDGDALVAQLTLGQLALTCEPKPGLLAPCYGDLVAEMAGRADALNGELTRLFTAKFDDIVLGKRVGTADTMADFKIQRAAVHASSAGHTALLRVDLYGALVE